MTPPASAPGKLVVVGMSHHLAPVALRERLLTKGGERAAEAISDAVREQAGPSVVLSTCNRLEVYCWTRRRGAAGALTRLLAQWSGLATVELAPHLFVRTGTDAAYHLIRVASGLDSLALGESQVLGQVRAAYQVARGEHPPFCAELDTLFRHAIGAARRIRRAGAFDRHPSVAHLAVERAVSSLAGLEGKRAAVLGAGVTGQEALRALLAAGVTHTTLLNRSRSRLAALRVAFPPARVSSATLELLPATLAEVDVLVCATSATEPVVSASAVAGALPSRTGRPLLLIDIAVPRDVDPAVRALPGVLVLDLDDLAAQCPVERFDRREVIDHADAQARDAACAFEAELRLRAAAPEVAAIRAHAEAIRAAEHRRVGARLAALTPLQRAAVEQLTHAIVQKLLHPPTIALRRAAIGATLSARRERIAILAALSGPGAMRRSRAEAHPSTDEAREAGKVNKVTGAHPHAVPA
ncbi:MAG TPA: glutamyl-tRNA reductase [Chloroflexota bacterium]|nr:glutamyl-tRNA reductase [Chloroflexota bacterium]